MKCLLLFVAFLPIALGNYAFQQVLREDAYSVAWNFNSEEQTVYFMVNASTTGWVGFGLSPDGGMANSDVVIGWVDDEGTPFLHDRYADAQIRPPVDAQQDWFLISGQETNGYTILMFSRNYTTCDNRDREINTQTQRVIFSWSGTNDDPANNDPDAVFWHGQGSRGSASLNLVGGLSVPPPEPEDSRSFVVGVENITVPHDSDTTYWCVTIELPPEVQAGTHYIYKYSPEIQSNSAAYVHHITVYQCGSLVNVTAGSSAPCFGEVASISPLTECMASASLGGWAVGGGDFLFPEDVAYRVSGPGRGRFVVMEMHYDNPGLTSGVTDSSGIRFFYTARQPRFEAGQLTIGAATDQSVIIPPNADNFTVLARCPIGCTDKNIGSTGIKIFANFFHTHLVGHGLVLEHYRMNEECGVLEELKPIDINLQYDFNYQQNVILPTEVTVLPGDVLILKCFYNTMNRNEVTLGGEGTRDEMCFAFPYFYPESAAFACGSGPVEDAYDKFIETHVPENLQDEFQDVVERIYRQDGTRPSRQEVKNTFNQLDWTREQAEGLEDALVNHGVYSTCFGSTSGFLFEILGADPDAVCDYQAPDVCTDFEPKPCCERLGAMKLAMNAFLVITVVCFAVLSM